MDIDAIRRANLQTLIDEVGGSIDALAEKADANPKYISQIQSGWMGKKDRKPRAVGTAMARRLEAAFGRPRGWMDSQHTYSTATAPSAREPVPATYASREAALRCAKALQEAVQAMARQAGVDAATLATNSDAARHQIADALMQAQSPQNAPHAGRFLDLDQPTAKNSTSIKKNAGA